MSEILKKVHEFCVKPTSQEKMGNLINWIGNVKVNKDIIINVFGADGKKHQKLFKKDVSTIATFPELSKLMMRAIQEGSEDMKFEYIEGNERVKPALRITLDEKETESFVEQEEQEKKVKHPRKIPSL